MLWPLLPRAADGTYVHIARKVDVNWRRDEMQQLRRGFPHPSMATLLQVDGDSARAMVC